MRISSRRLTIVLLIVAGSLLMAGITPRAYAANYLLTVTPSRVQESNIPGVVLAINVTAATVGATYKFTWQVTDPSGTMHQASNQTGAGGATSTTFVLSVSYPAQFGTNINYVGNYTINVQQNNPTNIPSVATGHLQVGLTDSLSYQRTFPVYIKARGYANNSPVTVNISHGGSSAPSYPTTVTTDSTGSLSATWTIPASVSTGQWTVSLTGSPVKSVPDVQVFTVYPTNVTITQLTLGQSTLVRSQAQSFIFTANYLSGLASQTGSAQVRITEPDGTTSFSIVASYNTTLGAHIATYRILTTSQTGAWVATIDPNGFDDGYGNIGPASSVVRGFNVLTAPITVSASIPSQTYTVGQVIPIYAMATFPDGSLFTNGTVVATLSSSGVQIGNPVPLTFVQGQSQWVGTYTVRSSDPSGLWLVTVKAADTFGNTGQQTVSAIVNVPPPPLPPTTQRLDLYYFILAALVVGSGGSGLLLLRRFNTTRGPFDELFKLTGGELSPATTLLIMGDPGSGVSTLGLEFIYRQLVRGEHCGLLAYDAFPSEIEKSMHSMGWDVTNNLKDGSFQILDCYSALAGNDHAPIRDPVDFTEISIHVSSMIEKAKGRPLTLLLDSITPIFNSAPAHTALNFLRVLGAKVKNKQGILILTGTRKSIPEEVRSNLENIVDGVIELGLARSGRSLVRSLTVRRLAGRKVSPLPTEFDIVAGRGILFGKSRISLGILSPKRKTNSMP